jgi:tetratricopeptide (TPR) repeat protein
MADHYQLEVAQRYASGQLDAAEAAAFEDHMVSCDLCQNEVKLTAGVRRLAQDLRVSAAESRASSKRFVGAAMLLAAGLALVMLWPRGDDGLAALGRVEEPPAYLGMSVRDARGRADSLFDAGMNAYVARRYDDAVASLRAALVAGVDTIPARFFLASSELMSGRAREAAETYALVIAAGASAQAYLPEAHLFRARALLQLGRGDEALKDLAAVSRESDRGAAAAALADSVAKVLQR